ncbi:MAG: hypothetical protein R3246_12785, partial [Acidimicrobiia bacterium]|nr:hypothetical protein [Acidimicrobiia bacterium]
GTDAMEIRWLTRSAGPGSEDQFVVLYRDGLRWLRARDVEARPTGYDDRVVHVATIDGLAFGSTYPYVVVHLRARDVVSVYRGELPTSLEPGDRTPFSFVAYGDSADPLDINPFRSVQGRILESDAAFALLLGDNVYVVGTPEELDARFRRAISPEATDWRSGRVDYATYGNHDLGFDAGRPSEQLFGHPGAENLPPPETPARNYSFDYGMVHIATFDSGAKSDPARLAALTEWLGADLAASDAIWKVVFTHYPVAGAPDKPAQPGDGYFDRLIPALVDAGADLLLVGDSHTFGWTLPLTGVDGTEAEFVPDPDDRYDQGRGVVQVIAGTGGRFLRAGSFTGYPFVARGWSLDTDPQAEHGFALVEVTEHSLTVSYVAASDGRVLGSFAIVRTAGLTQAGDHRPVD